MDWKTIVTLLFGGALLGFFLFRFGRNAWKGMQDSVKEIYEEAEVRKSANLADHKIAEIRIRDAREDALTALDETIEEEQNGIKSGRVSLAKLLSSITKRNR